MTGPFSDATVWQVGKGDGQQEWMTDIISKISGMGHMPSAEGHA